MEKSKRKVLFLITKSNWGGAQRYVHDLAKSLPTEGYEAVVALGGDGPLADRLREAGIRVISIPSLQRDLSLGKEWLAFWETADIIRRERPDILHINSSKAGVLGAVLGRLLLVPRIVFTAHGWAFNEDRVPWQRTLLKAIHWFTVLLSHQTIAVSNEVKRQMDWPLAADKMTVVYNGRALPHLKSREEARSLLAKKEPRLREQQAGLWTMTIAELHPVKRHEAVIDVVKQLIDQGEEFCHIIISDGELKDALRRQIDRLELQSRVFLLGAVPEAAEYLKAADVFVLASRSEAMPYAIIEAMMAEVPTVATAVGGIPEIIDNGVSGLLAPPLDNEVLGDLITRLLHDHELRDRLAAGARARQPEFTLAKTLEQTLAVYD